MKPIGIRLNNPGNIEWGDPWQGLVPRQSSVYATTGNAQQKRFAQFETPTYGIRAIARTLITYYDKRRALDGSKIDTVREVIERWAPAFENNVSAYATQVGRALCSDCEDPGSIVVNMHDYDQLRTLVEAIIRHENGKGPKNNINTWYSDAVIDEGLRLAGVRKPVPQTAKIPVTKEVVGGTATAGVGVSQLAEVAPAVADALTQTQDHLSSGQISRVIIGLVLLGLGIFIAVSQIQKNKDGTL